MKCNLPIIVILAAVVLFKGAMVVNAQNDTFGPICEEGVTCTPTQTPPAQPSPTLPVTGPMETTFAVLGLGAVLLLAGGSGLLSFKLAQKNY